MAVTLAGTPSVYENGSGTAVVLPYPTGVQAGELLVAHITHSHQTAPTSNPGGWTLIDSENSISGGPPSGSSWYKWADGSEQGTVTFPTHTTAGKISGVMARWAGVDPTTPLDASHTSSSTGAQTSYTPPTLTTVTAGARILYHISAYVSQTDPTDPADVTRVAASTNIGRKIIVATEVKDTPGTTNPRTWTHGSSIMWTGIAFPLRPAADGGTPPPPPPPPPGDDGGPSGPQPGSSPTLTSRAVGIYHENPAGGARVQSKTSGAVQVRLKVSTDAAGTLGVLYGPYSTPSSLGDARMTITNLLPGTRYYYRVMMKNAEGGEFADTSSTIGRFKTAPSGPSTFSICFSSCNSGYGTTTLTTVANRGDEMFLHLGDLFYADGSGTGISNFRSKMGTALTSAQNMWATTNSFYIPSDHDGMNNNGSYGDDPTAWTNWNIVRSELMPNAQSYQTWTWGPRVRIIMIDTRSFKSRTNETDNSSHTALGSVQKQWLKDTITAAEEPVIIIGQDSAWVTGGEAGEDSWEGFQTERNELASFFAASGKKIHILGGDQHALSGNDGSSSPGGAPCFMAAPIKNTASHKGGPWTVGPYPSAGTSNTEQYGRLTIEDTGGTTIRVIFKGYSSSTNTERVSITKTYTVEAYQGGAGTQVGLTRAEISATPPTPVTVSATRAEISVPTGSSSVRIARAEVAVVGSADPGPNLRNVSPGLTIEMTADAPGIPVNYTWDQIAGPTVTTTLSSDKSKCTYITPALKADSTLVFRVVASYADGTKSGEGITRHSVTRTAHQVAHDDGSTSTVTFRPIELGVPTEGGEEEPGGGDPPPPPPPPPPGYQPVGGPSGKTWTLTLAEDFNVFNPQLWTPKLFTEGGINNSSGTYERNVSVENNELSLMLESSTSGAAISSNPRDNVAGHVGFEFTTGYLEARIFFPGNGTAMYNWPVFMTMGQPPLPNNAEYDIAEVAGWAGDHGVMSSTYHYYDGVNRSVGSYIPGNWGGSWHTYALHRRTDMVNDYYYDGVLVHSHVRGETTPHYIAIVNEATVNATQVYGESSKVKVDYVRFWTESGTTPDTPPPIEEEIPGAKYVSAVSGNDSNPGTMAAPWKTLAKVRAALDAGEVGRGGRVLLKRGEVFYGSIQTPVLAGSSGEMIWDAYGTGAMPQINGFKVSLNSWVQHSTNIWKLNITAGSGQYTGNTGQTETNVGFLRVNGVIKGWKKWSLSSVGSDWDFYNDGTYVYVKLGQSPGAGVEIAVRQNGFRTSSNLRVSNMHVIGHGAHGFAQYTVNNCHIKNCRIEYIGGSALNSDTRYGNGIETWIGCSNILIENNYIQEVYDVGFTMQGTIEGSNKAWTSVHHRLNTIEKCNQGYELWSRGTPATGTGWINCSITDNIFKDQGYNWAALIRSDSIGRGTHVLTYDMELPCQLEVTRNIFQGARHNYAYNTYNGGVWPTGLYSHHNTITLAPGQKIVYQQPETIEQSAGYVSRTGNEVGTQFFMS